MFIKVFIDSDFLYWGEGKVSVGLDFIIFNGELLFGFDFKLYLLFMFIDMELVFKVYKFNMV